MAEQVKYEKQCWNEFCIIQHAIWGEDPETATKHSDRTGHSWEQARGTKYCPGCGDYVKPGDCEHESIVTTIYERDPEAG